MRPPMRAPAACQFLAHALAIEFANAAPPREPDRQELQIEARIESQDFAGRHRDALGHAIRFAADTYRHLIDAQYATARGHRLDQLGATDLASSAAKLRIRNETVAQQRTFEKLGRRQ